MKTPARTVVAALLDAPRNDVWSTDFYTGDRDELITYLARTGRGDVYGPGFEDLADPMAVHVPGSVERSAVALYDGIRSSLLSVTPDIRPGRAPLFGSGDYAAGGLTDIRGVALLLFQTMRKRHVEIPDELGYAMERIVMSGTHATAVSHALCKLLRRGGRK